MGKNNDTWYYHPKKPKLEERLGNFRNRMELIRTIVGFTVLCIQLFILYQLHHTK